MWTLTLNDGTQFTDLSYDGTNISSLDLIDRTVFTTNNISNMVLSSTNGESITLTDVYLATFLDNTIEEDGQGCVIVFKPRTPHQKILSRVDAIEDDMDITDEVITDMQEAMVDMYEMIINGVEV